MLLVAKYFANCDLQRGIKLNAVVYCSFRVPSLNLGALGGGDDSRQKNVPEAYYSESVYSTARYFSVIYPE